MKNITVQELKEMMDNKVDFQLLDIREPFEFEMANIGGTLIPMNDLIHNLDKIETGKKVVVMCHTGRRSAMIVAYLEQNQGIENLYNLIGGIDAWSEEIDSSVPFY